MRIREGESVLYGKMVAGMAVGLVVVALASGASVGVGHAEPDPQVGQSCSTPSGLVVSARDDGPTLVCANGQWGILGAVLSTSDLAEIGAPCHAGPTFLAMGEEPQHWPGIFLASCHGGVWNVFRP
jgi:hypothetical protein